MEDDDVEDDDVAPVVGDVEESTTEFPASVAGATTGAATDVDGCDVFDRSSPATTM